MISVEHMQELIDRFNSEELDIRDIIEQSYFGGRADAIDEFSKLIESAFLNTKFDITDVRPMAEQLKSQN